MPGPEGQVMTVSFTMMGADFLALNGGPLFKFNESISYTVPCKTQKEVDRYWSKLTSGGGKEVQCGWLKDKYGVSWQIIPEVLLTYEASKNRKKSQAVMEAMMKMVKLDIKTLKKAYDSVR